MKTLHRIAVLSMVAGSSLFAQQVLVLNNGTRIHGRYDGGTADTVRFLNEHGERRAFGIGDVQMVMFNASPGAMQQPYDQGGRDYQDGDAPPNGGWNQHAMIPAGTELVVRTTDPIRTHEANADRRYVATFEREVVDRNGNVVIPRGSPAHLIVRGVGDGQIAVDLRSVRVNGQRYILNSQDIVNSDRREGLGANQRTGKFAGGGALLGGIIGAIAGGGKGLAIGALSGAAAGAGAEVATRGPALDIPSETVLRFRLEHPVYLYQ